MMAPDSDHEVPSDGFDVHGASDYIVQPTLSSTAPNQALPLVSQGSLFSGSATVNSVGVSEIDGLRLHSSGSTNVDRVNSVGILPGIDNRGERTIPPNPKSFKKKNTYYQRRTGEKKERLIWTQELHQCFLEFYNQFPNEKRVPKKILEEMRQRFPYITRENVASHLQKHRLYLKNLQNKEMGNSAKSSSKSVPRKVAKEEFNFHHFNNNTSISTFPNNAAQFPLQSHSISTSPKNAAQFPLQSHSIFTSSNPQLLLQSHSISTNPNSQLPLQSHSISTNPNSQLPLQSHSISTSPNNAAQFPPQSHSISTNPNFQLPLQSHSLSPSPNYHLPRQSHILPEALLNQVVSEIDQTHLSDQNILHMQSSIDIGRSNFSIHGGANIYSNYNLNQMMDNVLESQRNPFGQSSNAAPDFPVRVNPFHPSIPTNIHDPYFDGKAFYPIIMGNSFRDFSGFDYSFGALPYYLDYNMSFNLDNFQVAGVYNMNSLGSYSDALLLDYPFNYNVANELQPHDFGQVFQPIFYPPANHLVDDASSLPQNSENPREEGAGMKERNGNSSNSHLPDGWSGFRKPSS